MAKPEETPSRAYRGVDVLEVMETAVNYRLYLIQLVASASGPPGGRRLLDFGAGFGSYAGALRELGYDVTCIEQDPELAERLGRRGFRAFQTIEDVAGEGFDVVYSLNVLEHIENDVGSLRQLRAVTTPQSKLVLYVPAFQFLYTAFDRKIGHLRRYRRPQLVQVVEHAGYDVSSCRYADSLGLLAGLAYRLAGSRRGDLNEGAVAAYDRFVFPVSRTLDKVVGHWFGKNVALVARPQQGVSVNRSATH
jgi:SAM-dependent methyltransferase